jgi:hypothetical protein
MSALAPSEFTIATGSGNRAVHHLLSALDVAGNILFASLLCHIRANECKTQQTQVHLVLEQNRNYVELAISGNCQVVVSNERVTDRQTGNEKVEV